MVRRSFLPIAVALATDFPKHEAKNFPITFLTAASGRVDEPPRLPLPLPTTLTSSR